MKKTLLLDFSRVLLQPKDKSYTGSLNTLYRSLLKQKNYNFFEHFELNTELLDYLRTMKGNYSIHILTSDIIQNALEIRGKLHDIFNTIYSANDLGFTKDDPEIYELITKKLQKNPKEIIFIDDSIENITAAKKAGLQAVHFTSNKQILKILQNA